MQYVHDISNRIFLEKYEKYYQFVVCWICPKSGKSKALAL